MRITSKPNYRYTPAIAAMVTEGKPVKRAMALRCIKSEGVFVFGDRYLACKGHSVETGQTCLYLDIMVDGELRSVTEERFVPENAEHWWMFSHLHRLRWAPESYGQKIERRVA